MDEQTVSVSGDGRAYSVGQGHLTIQEAPQTGPRDDQNRPGLFSLRPPLGALPNRVRGRNGILDRLASQLANPPGRRQLLHGLGGCGKTTIALELARTARERDQQVFWVSAAGYERLLSGMRQVAHELGAPEGEIEEAWSGRASAMDLVWAYLDRADRPWLLVLDNADRPGWLAAEGGQPGDGTGWARASRAGLTVVTSRTGAAEVWGRDTDRHLIDVLGPDDAADLLLDLTGPSAGTTADAKVLAERLGGLPLALRLAGSYLARTARGLDLLRRSSGQTRIRSFAGYTAALDQGATAMLDAGAPRQLTDPEAEHLHRNLVSRTWELSHDLLDEQGLPEARALMRLLSCFAPAPLPIQLLSLETLSESGLLGGPGADDRVERALEGLLDLSMLDLSSSVVESGRVGFSRADSLGIAVPEVEAVPCLTVHLLVLEANAARVQSAPDSERHTVWHAAAATLEMAAGPAPESQRYQAWWRLIVPHVTAALSHVPDDPDVLARVAATSLRAFAYLWFVHQYEDGRELARLLANRVHALDERHPVRLAARHRYALAVLDDDEAELAEYTSILEAQRQVSGPEDPETMITWHNFASALAGNGRLAEAEAELRAVLQGRRRVLGVNNPYTLITHTELAALMKKRGHKDLAKTEYEEIIRCYYVDEALGDEFLSLESRHQVAHALRDQGKFAEAERSVRSIIAELEETDPTNQHFYRDMRRCLSWVLRDQKRYEEAIIEYRTFLELAEDAADDPERLLAARHEFGHLLHRAGEYASAAREFRTVLDSRRRELAADDSVILRERDCLAHTLDKQGQREDAVHELQEVVEAYRRILGSDDATTIRALYCLSCFLHNQGRVIEAERGYRVVLAAETRDFGAEHPDTLVTRHRLAKVLHMQKRDAEAEVEYRATLEGRRRSLGDDHPRTAAVAKDLRRLLAKRSQERDEY